MMGVLSFDGGDASARVDFVNARRDKPSAGEQMQHAADADLSSETKRCNVEAPALRAR